MDPVEYNLVNELEVRSVEAVNQICVIHEAINGCKKSKDSLKDCFENVIILMNRCIC